MGSGQLVHRVKEDEERPLGRGEVEQLLEEGGDGDRVVRDVLEGEEERVGELLADGPGEMCGGDCLSLPP